MPAAQDGIIRFIVLPAGIENRFLQELHHHFHMTLCVNLSENEAESIYLHNTIHISTLNDTLHVNQLGM